MRKQTLKGLAVGLVAVVGLAACGSSDSSSDTTVAAGAAGLACEVTDIGGVDDKGFNQNAYDGLKLAEAELGVSIDLLESASDADYAPNLQSFVD